MSDLAILIAEDDEGQALLITKALSRNSSVSRVERFQNGREILDFLFSCPNIERGNILLLLDIRMPRVNGVEVLKEVKKHDALKSLPVMMWSSACDLREVDLYYRFGCNIFVSKPKDLKDVERLCSLDFMSILQTPGVPAGL